MKKLIFTLLILPTLVHSNEIKEISDSELSKKFISVLKDVEVEKIIGGSIEFRDCVEKNKFKKNQDNLEREKNAKEAEKCFREKLSKKSPEEIKQLSSKLGLQGFNLVQSDNVKDISDYLGNKMYKALTGIDLADERNKEMLKFKNRKLVDQKVFIKLYTTLLGKNALFEISRFCFEDLRKDGVSADGYDFETYWQPVLTASNPAEANVPVSDTGEGAWGTISDTTSKDTIYQDIFKGITANSSQFNPERMSGFFNFCSKQISVLCKRFESSVNVSTNTPGSTSPAQATPNAGNTPGASTSVGARACLTKDRLTKIRKALNDSEAISKQFDEELSGGTTVGLDKGSAAPRFYDGGRSNEAESIDNLTNFASTDILEGGKKKDNPADKCINNPQSADCDKFLVIDDSKDKALHATDMEIRLKKEAEIARIKKLKEGDQKSLEKFLEDSGYFELLEKYKNNRNLDFEAEIATMYEAKRKATLEAIKQKVGQRQMSEEESKNRDLDQIKTANAKVAQEERARLAQVVLFNNIITSHLKLFKKDSNGNEQEVGRNINPLKKEVAALESGSINPEFFQGLKDSASGADGSGTKDGESIVGIQILDTILGKKDK